MDYAEKRADSAIPGWRARGLPPGVEVIPVEHRVQREEETAVRLVAPERPDAKQNKMSLAERRVDQRGVPHQVFAAHQLA